MQTTQKTHIVSWTDSMGTKVYLYGDGMLTSDKAQALVFTKADAEAHAADLDRVVNARRREEGLTPHNYTAEKGA
jgi:hypothetical protein